MALSLLRGSTYDPAAGDVPKKRLFASLFFRQIRIICLKKSEGGLAATRGCMIDVSGRNPMHTLCRSRRPIQAAWPHACRKLTRLAACLLHNSVPLSSGNFMPPAP